MMRISTINEFILLAEKLNYTEAANLLFISQPTLSKHISDLEAELDITLLYRDKHGVALTEAGKIVYEQFVTIQKNLDELEKRLTNHKQVLSGYLRCGFLYYFIDEYVNPFLKILSESIPSFKPSLSYYQPLPLINALEKNDIDIAITYHYQYENASKFNFLDFSKEKPMIFTWKNHPLRKKESVSVKELKEETFVCLRSKPYTNHVLKLLRLCGIEDPKIVYCDQIDALDFVLNQTQGISLLPCTIQNMGRKGLYSIPVSDDKLFFPVTIVYKKENTSPLIPIIVKNIQKLAL